MTFPASPLPNETAIDGLRIRVDPESWSPAVLSAIYGGVFEVSERRACRSLLRAGDRVLDLGSGVGLVALLAATVAGPDRVTSYEANPALWPILRASAELNDLKLDFRGGAVVSALDPGEDTVAFHRSRNVSASSTLPVAEAGERVAVPAVLFEAVVAEVRPTFLSVDIEGGEAAIAPAMAGCGATRIILELHPQALGVEACAAVGEALADAGFRVLERLCDGQVICLSREVGGPKVRFADTAAASALRAASLADDAVDEGIAACREALARCDEVPSVHVRLSRLLLRAGDPDGAAGHAGRAVALAPYQFEGFVALSKAERGRGRPDEAVAAMEAALAFAGRIAPAWIEMTEVRQEKGDREGAFAAASRVVELNPAHGRIWLRRARLARALGRRDEMRRSTAAALRLLPKDPQVLEFARTVEALPA